MTEKADLLKENAFTRS